MADGLARDGHSATLITRKLPEAKLSGDDRVVIGDASSPDLLRMALADSETIVWCAGGLLPTAAEKDPKLDRDLTLTPLQALLSLDAELEDRRLIFLSSGGTIYGNAGPGPIPETHVPAPIGEYGKNRLEAERLIFGDAPAGLSVTALRCANVYGPGQPPDRGQGAVAVFADRIRRGEPLKLFAAGQAIRDFIHVDDVVDAVAAVARLSTVPSVLNCGSGRGTRIAELLSLLEAQAGRKAFVKHLPARDFEVGEIVLDIKLIRSLIAFNPVGLETGLDSLTPARAPI